MVSARRETHPLPDPRTRALGPWRTAVEFLGHEELFRAAGVIALGGEEKGGGVVYKSGLDCVGPIGACVEKYFTVSGLAHEPWEDGRVYRWFPDSSWRVLGGKKGNCRGTEAGTFRSGMF